jgi:glycosyltransferase involved in cell wall biosynthesis
MVVAWRRRSIDDHVTADRPTDGPSIAYIVNGFPRRSELFIASEIHRLEQQGLRLRTYVIRAGDAGEPHPVVRRIRATPEYLPRWTPVPGTPTYRWLPRNLPRFVPALARTIVRRPLGVLRAGAFTFDQATRARRASAPASALPSIKEFLLSVALADRLLAAPDVRHLHAAFAHRPATVAWMASMINGLPFSFTGHAKDIYVPDLNPAGLLARKLAAASFVVTCTEANRRHLHAIAPEAPIYTIYHGLNADFADLVDAQPLQAPTRRAPDGRLHVLGIGRLVPKKGFDILVESCALLREGGVDVELRIAGGLAEHTDSLRTLISARGLTEHARLVGPCTQAELYAELRGADVFCLPCRVLDNGDRDGIPNVLVEAMASGLPVVTTPVSGIPELIEDGVTGLLVPPDDPTALAGTLLRLLEDPALAERLGCAGQAAVRERFDGDRLAGLLASLFREAVP